MLDPELGIALFTDGSAHWTDRSGGYAWVALDAFEGIEKASGHQGDTTISQMELMGPIAGLTTIYERYGACHILVYSDSEYVVKGETDRKRKRKANKEQWQRLDAAVDAHSYVEFIHVPGHSDHMFNEMADELAGQARRAGIEARSKGR